MKKLYSSILLAIVVLSLSTALEAKRNTELVEIRPSLKNPSNSFVIFADIKTYRHCSAELEEFRRVLEKEGLASYIYATEWKRPEQVRGYMYSVNADMAPLEGVIFVGDIPVVKVKGAEYLASPELNAGEGDWIVTDRFYDDFHLDFNFCEADSTDGSYKYLLSSRGRQDVFCDVYSSRVCYGSALSNEYDEIKHIIASYTEAHKRNNNGASNAMRAGNLNKWSCTVETILEGDLTAVLSFADAQDQKEAEAIVALYKMTNDALYSGGNCTSKLLEIMKESSSAKVRKAALDCLAQFADSNCAEGVGAGLDDSSTAVREAAARYAAEMGIFPERAAQSNLNHEGVPAMVDFVFDESKSIEERIEMARTLGLYSKSYNRTKITEGLSVALSRRYMCPQPLREEILKTLRRIR